MRHSHLRLGGDSHAARGHADITGRRSYHDHPMALQVPHQRPAYPAALPRRRSHHHQYHGRSGRSLRQQRPRRTIALKSYQQVILIKKIRNFT